MRVVWTVGAVQSLKGIRQYIQTDNPHAAKRVADRIEHSVQQLEVFPHAGRQGLREGTRELVIPGVPYVVVYRVACEVQILRVFHAKQFRH